MDGPRVAGTIDIRNALRDSGATGVGTPGTGWREGDEAPAVTQVPAAVAFNVFPERGQGADLRAAETTEAAGITSEALAEQSDRGTVLAIRDGHSKADPLVGEHAPTLEAGHTRPSIYSKAMSAHDPEDFERWQESDLAHARDSLGDARDVIAGAELRTCDCCPQDPPPDSPRYRAVGDAVTVNVAEWIGHRLVASDVSRETSEVG